MNRFRELLLAASAVVLFFSCTDGADAQGRKESASGGVKVLEKWEVPAELWEISGLVWEDQNHLACLEDEHGVIYHFDIAKGEVSNQMKFREVGDFEAIAKAGDTYYAMRSDAHLFEIAPGGNVREYEVPIAKKEDIETLVYDPSGSQLLFMNKAWGKQSGGDALNIFAFDLKTKSLKAQPVRTIDLSNVDTESGGKKGKKSLNVAPSALAIHPRTGEYYILDGPRSGLLIADKAGRAIRYIQLDKDVFPQPEGITFSPQGELFLSSEAGRGTGGVIARVSL